MKTSSLLFFVGSLFITGVSCGQSLTWARPVAGPAFDHAHAIAADHSGNIFAAGSFINTVDFDPGAGVFNLSSTGQSDIFLTRYDGSGNFSWSKSMGGTGMDGARAIAIDTQENIILAGSFAGAADLDPGPGTYLAGTEGTQSIFISKLNPNGSLIWSKNLSSSNDIVCSNVRTDNKNNIYLTGSFKEEVDFDPGPGISTLKANGRMRDMYILKLDAVGNYLWSFSLPVNCNDTGNPFAVDPSGNVFVSGSFYAMDPVDFDPGITVHVESPSCPEDLFVLKFDTQRNFKWVGHLSGTFYNGKTSLALDKSSQVYLCGNFHGSADVDPGPASKMLTSNGSNPDCFITKLDAQGRFVWTKQIGNTGSEDAGSITVLENGEIVMNGVFAGTLNFDPLSVGLEVTSAGGYDAFVCRVSQDGDFLCAGSVGGPEPDRAALLISDNNNIIMSGNFSGTADMDPGVGTYYITPSSGEITYLCKLGECAGFSTSLEKKIVDEDQIRVFPNPTEGRLQVNNDYGLWPGSELQVLNILGEVLYQSPFKMGNNELNLAGQPRGIYFACIMGQHGERFIVKKIVLR
jgi:hypothetical protein